MRRLIRRGLATAIAGAAIGAASLTLAHARHPQLTFEFDRDPPLVSGFYPVERAGDETFAWTRGRASLTIPGLDRRLAWACAIRLRGARPDGIPQPAVVIAIDGVVVQRHAATPDYSDITITVPARRGRAGLDVSLTVDPPFVPSASDRRQLGVQVDRLSCEPLGAARPPVGALMHASIASGALAAALAVSRAGMWATVLSALLIAVWQSAALVTGGAAYSAYTSVAAWLAAATAIVLVVTVRLTEWRLGAPLPTSARFAAGFSAAVTYVKLAALLHPSKAIIDAVFHGHRLDWVLDGRLYFTQPLPDGVAFPYAIGLYLFAAPWSLLTDNHAALLRVVVTVAETLSGVLLYVLIARAWGDRLAAALAVVLFHLVPLPYAVIGNANQTNAFGQSAALVTIVSAAMWPLGRTHYGQLAALTLLALLAFLSHVSTVSLLAGILAAMAALYWWKGGASLRIPAASILIATTIAALLSVVLYYGHFGDAYRTLARVRSDQAAAESAAPAPRPAAPVHVRAVRSLVITASDIGLPILGLAAIGLMRLRAARRLDRMTLTLGAFAVAYVVFAAFGTVVPVSPRYERYAAEFVGRVDLATYPAAVIVAALGGAWLLRGHVAARVTAVALFAVAAAAATRAWYSWIT